MSIVSLLSTGRVVRITQDWTLERRRRYVCLGCKATVVGESKYEEFYAAVIAKCPNRRKDCPGNMRLDTKNPLPGDLIKYQEVMLQEIESTAVPRIFKATLEESLVGSCVCGDTVELRGTVEVRTNPYNSHKSNISIVVRCQSVRSLEKTQQSVNHEAALDKWRELVLRKGEMGARDVLLRSAFPNVKGMDYLKLSLLILMTGSDQRIKTRLDTPIRCQSHILLVGDPGTAKSQLLQWVARYTAPSLYTNAFGCSSAGLTAAAVKTGAHWTLQAGVLVLCDGGVCCIDEWNLLKPAEQASCHEAMEQQTVSMAKAGISMRMSTKCSIVAATNPKKESGAHELTTGAIGLSTSLISRFDLIVAVRDERDDEWDSQVIDFVLNLGESPPSQEVIFADSDIKAHLIVARRCRPVFEEKTYEVLTAYNSFCRNDEFRDCSRTTTRLHEGLIRLACGHARLCCRERVSVVDAVVAIVLMESSIGFGRLIRPLSMTKSAKVPLEPTRKMVEEVLRLLKVSVDDEEIYKSVERKWVDEGEEAPKAKKRKLDEGDKSISNVKVAESSQKKSQSAFHQYLNRIRQGSGSGSQNKREGGENSVDDSEKELLSQDGNCSVINSTQTQRIQFRDPRRDAFQSSSNEKGKPSKPVNIKINGGAHTERMMPRLGADWQELSLSVMEECRMADQEKTIGATACLDSNSLNSAVAPDHRDQEIVALKSIYKPPVEETENLSADPNSLDSLIMAMQEQQTPRVENNREEEMDHDEDQEVGFSQISFQSFLNRMRNRPSQSNRSVMVQLDKMTETETEGDDKIGTGVDAEEETLQVRLNDFVGSTQMESSTDINPTGITERNTHSPDIFNCSQPSAGPSRRPTTSDKAQEVHNFMEDHSLDDTFSQLIIPEEKSRSSQLTDTEVVNRKEKDIHETIEIPSTAPEITDSSEQGEAAMQLSKEELTFASFYRQMDFSLLKRIPKRMLDKQGNFQPAFHFKEDDVEIM